MFRKILGHGMTTRQKQRSFILRTIHSWSFILLLISSCSTSRRTQTIPVETIHEVVKTDTVYINNVQYDSIYVNTSSDIDRTRDTITVTKTNTEYRYKFLRDTVERIRLEVIHDSIPYEVRVVETKEVPRRRNLFDYLCYVCFGIVMGGLGLCFARLCRTLRYLIHQ